MSQLEEYPNSKIEEIKDIFYENINNQTKLKAYPEQFQAIRKPLVQWVINISKNAFLNQTLHRTISLYDLVISGAKTENDKVDINELKLTIVACLSISTKLNEHYANYVQFLTENILNASSSSTSPCYSCSDLSLKEIEILKVINYNVNSPNIYHFNSLFLQICLLQFKSNQLKDNFILLNTKVLNEYLASNYCVTMSSLNSAIIVLNETLNQFTEEFNTISQAKIIKSIKTLTEDNKSSKKKSVYDKRF